MLKKNKSKALGLKSVLASNDEIVLSSFGRGNESILEHKLDVRMILYYQKNLNLICCIIHWMTH